MVLHEGQLAEMATGEGKTLVATLRRAPRGERETRFFGARVVQGVVLPF